MPRYLIVDDNVEFAENVAEILADTGAEAQIASGGAQALELCATTRFDALLCDMRMPVMSGAEVVHRIRSVDPGLPAIVVTAYTADEELAAARRECLLAVLPKPLPLPKLLELLASARRDGLVAIVEDDAALADNLSEVLRTHGLAAITAGSVLEAERLGGVRPFAAIVDLRVPGGEDGDAMRRLTERFPGLPMIVVSGHDQVEAPVPHVARFGKPFDTGRLLATLDALYAQHARG